MPPADSCRELSIELAAREASHQHGDGERRCQTEAQEGNAGCSGAHGARYCLTHIGGCRTGIHVQHRGWNHTHPRADDVVARPNRRDTVSVIEEIEWKRRRHARQQHDPQATLPQSMVESVEPGPRLDASADPLTSKRAADEERGCGTGDAADGDESNPGGHPENGACGERENQAWDETYCRHDIEGQKYAPRGLAVLRGPRESGPQPV